MLKHYNRCSANGIVQPTKSRTLDLFGTVFDHGDQRRRLFIWKHATHLWTREGFDHSTGRAGLRGGMSGLGNSNHQDVHCGRGNSQQSMKHESLIIIMSFDPKPCGSCLHCAANAFCPIVVSQRIFHYQIATSMTGLCKSDRPSVNCGLDMMI